MAKANLPVNFKDDILKENMNGKRRFNMIQNSDGTVSFEDVTDYTQVGSTFGAAQINATNTAVNNAADASKIIDSLETIKANTQSGYIAGALAVKELNSNLGKKIAPIYFRCNADGAGTMNFTVKQCKTVTIDASSGAYAYYQTVDSKGLYSDKKNFAVGNNIIDVSNASNLIVGWAAGYGFIGGISEYK